MGYILKLKSNGEIAKYKVRLVVKRFLQRSSLDFNENFSPAARIEIITISTYKDCLMYQLGVKSTFLNAPKRRSISKKVS